MKKRKHPMLAPLPEYVAAWMTTVSEDAPELHKTFQRISRLHASQSEDVTGWLNAFKARVAEIAPKMIEAATEKVFGEIEEMRAAHPESVSDSYIQEYGASMREYITRQHTLIAEGRVFREEFTRRMMSDDPGMQMSIHEYFYTQRLCMAWLIGFSNDAVLRDQWEQQKMTAQLDELRRASEEAEKRKAKGRRKGADTMRAKGNCVEVRRRYKAGMPWTKDQAAEAISVELNIAFRTARDHLKGA